MPAQNWQHYIYHLSICIQETLARNEKRHGNGCSVCLGGGHVSFESWFQNAIESCLTAKVKDGKVWAIHFDLCSAAGCYSATALKRLFRMTGKKEACWIKFASFWNMALGLYLLDGISVAGVSGLGSTMLASHSRRCGSLRRWVAVSAVWS